MIKSFRALISDSDVQSRVRLKETLRSIVYKNDIRIVRSLREAESALSFGEPYDGVFLSSENELRDVLNLIKRAQQTTAGRKPIYVVVLKADQQKSSYIAGLYLSCVDGYITEPFVAEHLEENLNTLLADKRRKIEEEEKKRSVFGFLISAAADSIDQRVKELYRDLGTSGGYTMKELRSTCAQLRALAGTAPELFEEVLIEKFESIPPPRENVFHKKKKRRREKMQHPGEAVKKMIEERGLPMDIVQNRLGLEENEFNLLLSGEVHVDEALAKKLSHILGNTTGFWVHLQNMCDARKKNPDE